MPNLRDIWSHIGAAFSGERRSKDKKPTLYDYDLSGNAYKVRLLLSILGVDYVKHNINLLKTEQKSTKYLKLNPFGQVPAFVDGETRLRNSLAILIYVAGAFDPGRSWWPADPDSQALIAQWLATAGQELTSVSAARRAKIAADAVELPKLQDRANAVLKIIDAHLLGREWLELNHPTIGDIAVFAPAARAEEGGVSLAPYPNLRAWIERVRGLPGFIPFPGQ